MYPFSSPSLYPYPQLLTCKDVYCDRCGRHGALGKFLMKQKLHGLPVPALALVRPRPILAVSLPHEGVCVLGLAGPPGEALLQLVLQGET